MTYFERNEQREQCIRNRMSAMGFNEEAIVEFGLYDWENWEDHYNWIMNASFDDIVNWIKDCQCTED
jgi:hypothetical protein